MPTPLPSALLATRYGPVHAEFHGLYNVRIATGAAPLVIDGVRYDLSVVITDELGAGALPDPDRGGFTGSVWRRGARRRSGTTAARAAIRHEVIRCVQAYANAHPEVLRRAERVRLENAIEALGEEIAALETKLQEKREAREVRRAELAALETEGPAPA